MQEKLDNSPCFHRLNYLLHELLHKFEIICQFLVAEVGAGEPARQGLDESVCGPRMRARCGWYTQGGLGLAGSGHTTLSRGNEVFALLHHLVDGDRELMAAH